MNGLPNELAEVGAQFDHAAHAAPRIRSLLPIYHEALGGRFHAGGDNPRVGYRGVQLVYERGGKIELLEPLPGSTFFESFFERHPRGGLHHLTFTVLDIEAAIAAARTLDLDVVGYFEDGDRAEAFLHPRSTHGALVQLVWTAPSYRPMGGGGTLEEVLGAGHG